MKWQTIITATAIAAMTAAGYAETSGAGEQEVDAAQEREEQVYKPVVAGPWKHIYKPKGRVFPGPDGPTLRAGEFYEDWVPNDHTFVQDADGRWHAFGITGPSSPQLHEAEWQAFHISGMPEDAAWEEHDLVLTAPERPDDPHNLWAPFVVERDGVYHMFYGPFRMTHAVSKDLFDWELREPAFEQDGMARDAWITQIDGRYHMVYVASNQVWLRTSEDLEDWSEGKIIFEMRRPGNPESPMLVPYKGKYYLIYTIHDGTNTAYDNRTFVFVSEQPDDFSEAREVTMFRAHAPEIFIDDGQWYISTVEWPHRGVSVAPFEWEPDKDGE